MKHKYIFCPGVDSRYPVGEYVESPLSRMLTELKAAGAKVLGFERMGNAKTWAIKVMQ